MDITISRRDIASNYKENEAENRKWEICDYGFVTVNARGIKSYDIEKGINEIKMCINISSVDLKKKYTVLNYM